MNQVLIPSERWLWVVATFSDHVVASLEYEGGCKYYKIGWKMDGDEPKLDGEPKEVEISVRTELIEKMRKAGRTLSKRNLELLKEVHEDLKDLAASDGIEKRGDKALIERCASKIKKLIDEYGDGEEEKPKSITVEEAMAVVWACGTEKQKNRMVEMLVAESRAEKLIEVTEQYRAFVGLR